MHCSINKVHGFSSKTVCVIMFLCGATLAPAVWAQQLPGAAAAPAVASAVAAEVANGALQGTREASGVISFKGVPFAAPPVGPLRWKAPQPVANWRGVRKADTFGPRPMQLALFGDMGFRSTGMSEDSLYLNVWTPDLKPTRPLPVMVYFYGGGFSAGDGSEPRYDGASMARKGIVTLTVNYRLGVFGFLAHPELTAESPHKASGNYGLLDQQAALQWVQRNIAAFGGDPKQVTIAGESAGSVSVSAHMASPLSKPLFAGAIGESGSVLAMPTPALREAEQNGIRFADSVGGKSLADLRALPAEELLAASGKPGLPPMAAIVDGYFLPRAPLDVFKAGDQAQVPLLVGWNSQEGSYLWLLGQDEPTPENYDKVVRAQFAARAETVLKMYPGTTPEQVRQSAADLTGDRFLVASTWKWYDLHRKAQPVYRYYFSRARPVMRPEVGNVVPGLAGGLVAAPAAGAGAAVARAPETGAVHSAEIEYALGNLAGNRTYAWTSDDFRVSRTMQNYFANFIKHANPNGPGLAPWSSVRGGDGVREPYMNIDVKSRQMIDRDMKSKTERYEFFLQPPVM
jgi:para-nitrobenzyl esterase